MFVCAVRVVAIPLTVVQVVRWEWARIKAPIGSVREPKEKLLA